MQKMDGVSRVPDCSIVTIVNLPAPPNTPRKPGTPASLTKSYQANTDPVYDEFAVQPRRSSSSNQLLKTLGTFGTTEPRQRLNSFSSLLNPEIHHDTKVHHAARPSTTDGSCKQKSGSQVFWEDLIDLAEGNEKDGAEQKGIGRLASDSEPRNDIAPPEQVKPSTGKQKSKENATPLPVLDDSGIKKMSTVKRAQLPPQPLVRFNSSGDFKAVVDDLYGKIDKRKQNTKPTKWGSIKRMANFKSQYRFEPGNTVKTNSLTLKQREEKAIKLKEAAAHGWRVIRWYIEHQRLRKYISGSSLGWTVLKQHLNNMSDVQNSRQDLYKRYGVIPTQQSDGSFKATNTMRPRKCNLKLVAFKRVKKPTNEKKPPKPPAFRETILM